MAELRGLGAVHEELARRGGMLLAISVDPPDRNRIVVEKNTLPFPILADVDRAVTRAYGVVHEKGGPDGSDVPLPAQFLIDRDGKVAWRRVATKIHDRPDPAEVQRHIRALP